MPKIIVFEGPEGSGKSTQARLVCDALKARGVDAELVREPGGVKISEKIREIILDPGNKHMSPVTEAFLYAAARAQVIKEKIKPMLKSGKTVIMDRFYLSTIVYQGYARGLGRKLIDMLNKIALDGIEADHTFVYDVSLSESKKRLAARAKKDRMDMENDSFHRKVRNGYLKEAKLSKKITVIKTDKKTAEEITKETLSLIIKKRLV